VKVSRVRVAREYLLVEVVLWLAGMSGVELRKLLTSAKVREHGFQGVVRSAVEMQLWKVV
jgi:hypothetical protein